MSKQILIKDIGTGDYGYFYQKLSDLIAKNCYRFEIIEDESFPVELPVKPACDGKILQAKIDENEHWLKFLNADASNIIHKSSLIDRVKFLENENRKSV